MNRMNFDSVTFMINDCAMKIHKATYYFGSTSLQFKKIFNPKYNANPENPKIQ